MNSAKITQEETPAPASISVPRSSEVISTKQLVKKTLACVHTLSREAAHVLASQECLSWLNNNPEGRNLVMLVSADRLPACKTQEVLDAHAGVLTQDEFDARPASLAERRVMWCTTRTLPCI
jgi:hypothetical protein